jgi:hypothetical protein
MKFDSKKMDIENLDELIGKCEDSMVSPFKKKKDAEEGSAEEEAAESPDEESAEKPDLSDMDLDDLLKLYSDIKDRT